MHISVEASSEGSQGYNNRTYTIEVIRIRKSMDRQQNGQKKNDKGTNIDLQTLNLKLKMK
jgi:hypothetical protein